MRGAVMTESRKMYFPLINLQEMVSAPVKYLSLPLLFLIAFFSASPALAALCADSLLIRQDMALKRQLTAVKNLERSRKCTAESAQGGFFNACRDLAQRRAGIQSKLQASAAALARCSGSAAASKIATKAPSVNVKTTDSARSQSQFLGQYSGTPLLFCVRLSDGYYFPAPHSQFAKSDQIKETLAQCSFICETSDVNLYVLKDPAAETSDMLSVDKRETYGSLPTAYRYQSDRDFNKCNWAKYNSYIQQVRHGREKHKKNKVLRPVEIEAVNDAFAEEPAPVKDMTAELADRTVRIVGTEFLQQDNDMLINFDTGRQHTDAGLQADKSIE